MSAFRSFCNGVRGRFIENSSRPRWGERMRRGASLPFLPFSHYTSASLSTNPTQSRTIDPGYGATSLSGRTYACHDIPAVSLATLDRIFAVRFDRTASRADSRIRGTDVYSLVALPPGRYAAKVRIFNI